ncbi:hypothetical protein ACFX12_018978 [Malus domestica]
MAEVPTIRAALWVCIELGYMDVELESDSQRSGNTDAHVVASYVASHGGALRWDAIGPEFLFNILVQDVNVSVRI